MSTYIRLYGINSNNDYKVYYKSGTTLNSETTGFTLYNSFVSTTTGLTISGVSITQGARYWVKIEDSVTKRYIIENIDIHEKCYYNCYNATPTPTPVITPTPTPTPTVNSATICIGDGRLHACSCPYTATVYFVGILKEGVTLYTSSSLSTKYYNGLYPNINYNNNLFTYPVGGGPLVADGICPTPTPTPTGTPTATPTPSPTFAITPTPTPTPSPTTSLCNNVINLYVTGGQAQGEGFIQVDIALSRNVVADTQFTIKTTSTNYGTVNVNVTVFANSNYASYIDPRGVFYDPGEITGCIDSIVGDTDILCTGFGCTTSSCVCSALTPTPTATATPTPTPTPTPLGECVNIDNLDAFNSIDVSYYNSLGNLNCLTLGPGASQILCIQVGTHTSINAYDSTNGTCSGSPVSVTVTQLLTGCWRNGDCSP